MFPPLKWLRGATCPPRMSIEVCTRAGGSWSHCMMMQGIFHKVRQQPQQRGFLQAWNHAAFLRTAHSVSTILQDICMASCMARLPCSPCAAEWILVSAVLNKVALTVRLVISIQMRQNGMKLQFMIGGSCSWRLESCRRRHVIGCEIIPYNQRLNSVWLDWTAVGWQCARQWLVRDARICARPVCGSEGMH